MKKHSILPQAEEFLQETMKIPISKIEESHLENYSFPMKDYSSMLILTGVSTHITVVVSFDKSLLEQIIKRFLGIKEINKDDKEELYLDASGEVINIIVGLAKPEYAKGGESLHMGLPIKINSVNNIIVPENHSVINEQIYTESGNMDISIIKKHKEII